MSIEHFHGLIEDPVGVVADIAVHQQDKSSLKRKNQKPDQDGAPIQEAFCSAGQEAAGEQEQEQQDERAEENGKSRYGVNQSISVEKKQKSQGDPEDKFIPDSCFHSCNITPICL